MDTPLWFALLGSACSGLCFLTLAVPLLILVYFSHHRIERVYQELMNRWASENGWLITRQERRILRHPWIIQPIRNQRVYYVTVTYRDGRPFFRHAWIRGGGWYWRPTTAKLEFTWDEVVPQPLPPPTGDDVAARADPLWDPWLDS
jgi:hypothetical protein